MAKEPLNILFVLLQISTGGTEKVVYEIAKNLDKQKYNLYVAYFNGGIMLESFRQVCKGVFPIKRKGGWDVRAALQIALIIRKYHIDTVNPHHYAPYFYSFFGAKLFGKARLIYTEHSAAEVEIFNGIHKLICNGMMFYTDLITGVSKATTLELHKMFPLHLSKFMTVMNAIDIQKFSPDETHRNVKRSFYPEGCFVIGVVANFRHVKNHQCLIEAFNIVHRQRSQTKLLLVGKSFSNDLENSEPVIRELINHYNLEQHVIFSGYRDDIAQILWQLDLFCLPSLSEGLPISILEAMAAKCPVVGSNVRGIREVVTHEQTGLLFRSNDHDELALCILRLIDSTEFSDYLINNAYEYVEQHHNFHQWIKTYEGIFHHEVA